jgi:recombination protein RecT
MTKPNGKDTSPEPAAGAAALALEVKNTVVDIVTARVAEMTKAGELVLPPDYSHTNAAKAAWLELQEVRTKDKKLAIYECSKDSIANALLSMVTQGLYVGAGRRQGYFIAYGKSLAFQRSYFGDMALVKRIVPGVEFAYAVVWADDEFEYELKRGRKEVTTHRQKVENIGGPIKAGYAIVEPPDRPAHTVVMTWAQIEQSWKQSKTYKSGDAGTTHAKFDEEMVYRTVIRRACKPFINSSSDRHLLAAIQRSDEASVEAEVTEELEESANAGELLELEAPAGGAIEAEVIPSADEEDANAARRGF